MPGKVLKGKVCQCLQLTYVDALIDVCAWVRVHVCMCACVCVCACVGVGACARACAYTRVGQWVGRRGWSWGAWVPPHRAMLLKAVELRREPRLSDGGSRVLRPPHRGRKHAAAEALAELTCPQTGPELHVLN